MVTALQLTDESTSRFFTNREGVKVHYNEAGSGPTLVLIHGGGPGATGWSNFNRNIGYLAEKHHVILLDQAGYGQTDYMGNQGILTEQTAGLLRDLLDDKGIEKCIPVGNSMGGAASITFTLDNPGRVDKLVLMGAAGSGRALFAGQPTAGIGLLQEARRNPNEETMRRLMHYMVYDDSFLTDELLQQRLKAAIATKRNEPPPRGTRDLYKELDQIDVKTLIIWGSHDHMEPLDGGLRFLQAIPNSRLHVFSRCGHWAQFEYAEEFNRLVEDFVAH